MTMDVPVLVVECPAFAIPAQQLAERVRNNLGVVAALGKVIPLMRLLLAHPPYI